MRSVQKTARIRALTGLAANGLWRRAGGANLGVDAERFHRPASIYLIGRQWRARNFDRLRATLVDTAAHLLEILAALSYLDGIIIF
jgi:hypothetical protein